MGTILTHYSLESDWKQNKLVGAASKRKRPITPTSSDSNDKNIVIQQDNPVRHGAIVNPKKPARKPSIYKK